MPIRQNLETLKRVFETGLPAVSDLYPGAGVGHLVVGIEVPVKRADGTVSFVLTLSPSLDMFETAIRRQQPPISMIIAVLDREGAIVARIPNPKQFVGQHPLPRFMAQFNREREGVLEATSLEQTSVVTAFSHGERFGWSVAIGVPKADLIEPALQSVERTLAAAGVVLGLSVILALVLARQITRPIGLLRRLAAASDLDTVPMPPSTGLREADEVVEALRGAARERHRIGAVAQRVRGALRESEQSFLICSRMVRCRNGSTIRGRCDSLPSTAPQSTPMATRGTSSSRCRSATSDRPRTSNA
ncbi:MAG: hypothetical protein WDO24_21990 [Pseudomonadota bacterium]